MNSTSIDGNCGSNSDTSATCIDSTFGDCCSAKGYCGSTSAYCGEGCQLAFGECNDASEQTVSTTGSCGATLTSNVTCLGSTYGDCCSGVGYCGGNTSYCGTGCQSEYGSCGFSSSTPTPTPTLVLSPSPESSGGLSKGAIAGISVGAAVAGLSLIALLVWWAIFRKRTRSTDEDTLIQVSKPAFIHEMDGRVVQEMESKGPTQVLAELPGSH